MDSYSGNSSDFDPSGSEESLAPDAEGQLAGSEERRMQVRAYNHWVSLLGGRELPSIDELDYAELTDFADNSLLIDFTSGPDNPALPYVGAAIGEESGLSETAQTVAQVPPRSLLSRVIGHCPRMIAGRVPFGFESEFDNARGETLFCRGVLLPFSSDGETIDFVYGVVTWKSIEAPKSDEPAGLPPETRLSVPLPKPGFSPQNVDLTDLLRLADEIAQATALDAGLTPAVDATAIPDAANIEQAQVDERASADAGDDESSPASEPAEVGSLSERLRSARTMADSVKAGESRTRAALYQALSLAYDFAVAADQNPDEYAGLLEASGVKAQARAPMTAIAKLVFGVDYDKTRLTEFAAALSYAKRVGLGVGEFQGFIEDQAGGLKGLVAAERLARRPESRPDKRGDAAREKLRSASPISLEDLPAKDEFAVVVTRRCANGRHEPVALVHDEALVKRVIRTIG